MTVYITFTNIDRRILDVYNVVEVDMAQKTDGYVYIVTADSIIMLKEDHILSIVQIKDKETK